VSTLPFSMVPTNLAPLAMVDAPVIDAATQNELVLGEEALFREARRVRRRRWTIGLLAFVLLGGTAAVAAIATAGVSAASQAGRCRDSQVTAVAAQLPGAAVSGGWVIRYRNDGSSTCTLSGYPTVVALVGITGPSEVAAHIRNGVLGGFFGQGPGARTGLPTVLLHGRTSVASSVVEFVSAGTAQSPCTESKRLPLLFRTIWVNLPGDERPFALKVSMLVCAYLAATPLVPGATGTAH
jgi:hypothetical protein